MRSIKSKIALITGASSGFGEATAYRLAAQGCNLILIARRLTRLKKISDDIKEKFSVDVYPIKLDVRNQKEVSKAISKLPSKWKKIDFLINNAGLSRGLNKIQDGLISDWEEMIDTNVKGLLYVTKAVIPLMIKNGSGHIVNIGSIAGREVYPAGNVYCASKHAVDALTKGFRIDLLGTNIKVSTVDPGLAETEFSIVRFHGDKKRAKAVYDGLIPLYADDVADAIEYILTRDDNVLIAEILIFPKAQASSMHVHRELGKST